LASENYSPWAIVWYCYVIPRLAVLVEHRLVTDTDRQTDRQTHRQTRAHGYYRGFIASRGKKLCRIAKRIEIYKIANSLSEVYFIVTVWESFFLLTAARI